MHFFLTFLLCSAFIQIQIFLKHVSFTYFVLLLQQSSWKKIRGIIKWSPFVQVFKKNKYPWIQLAGHQGKMNVCIPVNNH